MIMELKTNMTGNVKMIIGVRIQESNMNIKTNEKKEKGIKRSRFFNICLLKNAATNGSVCWPQ